VRQEARHLRDGEDEHEIEEELERRDPLFALGLSIIHPDRGRYRGASLTAPAAVFRGPGRI
jgi:hypothetical protein